MIPQKLKEILNELKISKWLQPLLKFNVFVVGGTVRDAFMNKPMKDIDLIVEGISLDNIQILLRSLGKVDIVGESFSVIKFKPCGFKGEPFDIAVPRMDRKVGAGHKGFETVTDGVDLLTDLKRRDFTINSIAVNVNTQELIDPFNGLDDLKNKLLVATDERAFVEDPLRILRGIQFSARFGFDIGSNTLQMMKDNAHLVKEISGERIFEELMKILNKSGDTQLALSLLHDTDVDKALFDKNMLVKVIKGFEKLDPISFFIVLGTLGGVDSADFLKNRLKGDAALESNVRTLDRILSMTQSNISTEDLRFMLFKAFTKSPQVMDADILPPEVEAVVSDMRNNIIPTTDDDILISGDEIMVMGNLKQGPEIGFIKEKIQRDALMNRFNWKNKKDSLLFLQKLLN